MIKNRKIKLLLLITSLFLYLLIFQFDQNQKVYADIIPNKEIKDEVEDEKEEVDSTDANLEKPDDLDDYEPEVTEYEDDGKLDDPFEVEISIGTQSAWNKSIPIFIQITPLIDSSRTEIRWDSGYGVNFEPEYENFFPMTKGETETFEARIEPTNEGVFTITGSVTDWGYGRNYISSDSLRLTLNEDLVTEPRTAGYTTGLVIKYMVYAIIAIVLAVTLFIGGRILFRWLKVWLKPIDY